MIKYDEPGAVTDTGFKDPLNVGQPQRYFSDLSSLNLSRTSISAKPRRFWPFHSNGFSTF